MGTIKPNQRKKDDRNVNDKYITPPSMIQQFLDSVALDKGASILEPCASPECNIGNVLRKNGFTDITENIYDDTDRTTDFLTQPITPYDYIITNTPYGDKNITAFILKMKKVATKKIVALYPITILQGTKRFNTIWSDTDFPLKAVWLFVRPPLLKDTCRADGCYFTGMTFYAWFVWERGYIGDVSFHHINNQKYCLTDVVRNNAKKDWDVKLRGPRNTKKIDLIPEEHYIGNSEQTSTTTTIMATTAQGSYSYIKADKNDCDEYECAVCEQPFTDEGQVCWAGIDKFNEIDGFPLCLYCCKEMVRAEESEDSEDE